MASISEFNRHPDEVQHLAAAIYYTDHWIPPVIGDPVVRDSYSVWGVSYLNYHWIEYFLAGKFARMISPVIADPRLAARYFNVSLLLFIFGFFVYRAIKDDYELILPGFFLISPQIWYVFSYSNNDALGLTVSALLAYQITYTKSSVSDFLDDRSDRLRIFGGVLAGLFAGLILICKPNYWVFLAFTVGWLFSARPWNRLMFRRYMPIVLIALLVFSFRIGLDLYVNSETNFAGASYINYFFGGFETKEGKLLAYQEEIAAPEFKPSTLEQDLNKSLPPIKLKAKGVTALQMLSQWRWHLISFASLVGVYGYMDLWAPNWYYLAMFLLYAALFVYIGFQIVRSGKRVELTQLLLTFLAAATSIFISFYLSWNYAFQAQGRYLFPIIPMSAVLVYSNRNRLNRSIMFTFTMLTFLLSVYSFVFVGLTSINGAP
jgi:hypothetical protein